MANLGGKITLDISEFQQKIAEANKLIRSNESAWRASAAQMDDWSASEDGIKTRLDASNKQIELQRNILITLAEKKKAIIEAYGEESAEVDKVNKEIIKYSQSLDKSVAENKKIVSMLDKVQSEQSDEKKAVESVTKVTKKNTNAVDKNAKEYDSLQTSVKKAGDGFTVFKGVVAGLVANALTAAVKSITSFAHAVNTLPESTRALRKELIQIETAFSDVGLSAEVARRTYVNYSATLGDIDSNANTTISLLAAITSSETQVAAATTTLAGVYAKLGKAIPTNELVKNIQQAANTAKMTENLTKVLQSAGLDVNKFTTELTALNTAAERGEYILAQLNKSYGELGALYIDNNAQLIAAEKAQLKLNVAMSNFGNMMEPIKTSFTETWAEILGGLGALLSGDQSVLPELTYNIGYLAGTVVRTFKVIYNALEPALTAMKTYLTNWFNDNKEDIKTTITDFLGDIFGETAVAKAVDFVAGIVAPIKTFFKQINDGDYIGALGTALPVITIGVGLSLLNSTISAIPSLLLSQVGSAMKTSGITLGSAVAGLIGVVSLGLAVKDAMTGETSWANFGANMVAALLAGLAAAGLTCNVAGGVIVASLVLKTKVGEEAYNYVKDAVANPDTRRATVGLSVIEAVKQDIKTAQIDKLVAEKIEAGALDGVDAAKIKIKQTGVPPLSLKFKITGITNEEKIKLKTEVENILNILPSAPEKAVENVNIMYAILSDAGKKIAEAIVAGYGIGIEGLPEIGRMQATLLLQAMKDTLGIRSPSKEAEEMGLNFTQGWADGLEGLPRKTEEIISEAVAGAEAAASEVKGFWGQVWDSFKGHASDAWARFTGGFVNAWEYVKKSFTSWAGFFGMLKDGAKQVGKAFTTMGEAVASIVSMYDAEEGAESIYNGIMDKAISALQQMGGWGTLIGVILQVVTDAIKSGDAEQYIEQLVDAVVEAINMLFENATLIAKLVITFIKSFTRAMIDNLPLWLEQLPDIISEIINTFMAAIPEFIEVGAQLIGAIFKGIWNAIKSLFRNLINGIKSLFGIHSPSTVMRDEVGRNLGLGVAEGIKDTIPAINSAMREVNTTLSYDNKTMTAAGAGSKVVYVTQNNNYARSYSAYELYKSERAIKQLVGAY